MANEVNTWHSLDTYCVYNVVVGTKHMAHLTGSVLCTGSRVPFNTLTGVIDANTVYGVTEEFTRYGLQILLMTVIPYSRSQLVSRQQPAVFPSTDLLTVTAFPTMTQIGDHVDSRLQ